jgi:Leucine-rich repeat (LRR) protein
MVTEKGRDRRGGAVFGILVVTIAMMAGGSLVLGPPARAQGSPAQSPGGKPATVARVTPRQLHTQIKLFNPDYNGKGQFWIQQGQVRAAQLAGTGIGDLSPLKGLRLGALDLRVNPLSDLGPLANMPLVELYLEQTRVADLSALRGIALKVLYLSNTAVADLSPLSGMPLEKLNLLGTRVTDITPLKNMPLKMLWLNETPVTDISPLSGTPLMSLTLHRSRVADLRPLSHMALQRLHIGDTPVEDLTPLANLALRRLIFTPANISRGLEAVREMTSLSEIGTTFENRVPADQFWQRYDRGEFKP